MRTHRCERRSGALCNELWLLLSQRCVKRHYRARTGHVARPDGDAFLQQPRQRVGTPGDPIQPCGYQHCPELPAAGQRRLEPWPAVVLARGDILVLGD